MNFSFKPKPKPKMKPGEQQQTPMMPTGAKPVPKTAMPMEQKPLQPVKFEKPQTTLKPATFEKPQTLTQKEQKSFNVLGMDIPMGKVKKTEVPAPTGTYNQQQTPVATPKQTEQPKQEKPIVDPETFVDPETVADNLGGSWRKNRESNYSFNTVPGNDMVYFFTLDSNDEGQTFDVAFTGDGETNEKISIPFDENFQENIQKFKKEMYAKYKEQLTVPGIDDEDQTWYTKEKTPQQPQSQEQGEEPKLKNSELGLGLAVEGLNYKNLLAVSNDMIEGTLNNGNQFLIQDNGSDLTFKIMEPNGGPVTDEQVFSYEDVGLLVEQLNSSGEDQSEIVDDNSMQNFIEENQNELQELAQLFDIDDMNVLVEKLPQLVKMGKLVKNLSDFSFNGKYSKLK
jgi:hypothetical protein